MALLSSTSWALTLVFSKVFNRPAALLTNARNLRIGYRGIDLVRDNLIFFIDFLYIKVLIQSLNTIKLLFLLVWALRSPLVKPRLQLVQRLNVDWNMTLRYLWLPKFRVWSNWNGWLVFFLLVLWLESMTPTCCPTFSVETYNLHLLNRLCGLLIFVNTTVHVHI